MTRRPAAVERFLEFFAAGTANARTRGLRAGGRFLAWCGARGLCLGAIAPLHVALLDRIDPGTVVGLRDRALVKRDGLQLRAGERGGGCARRAAGGTDVPAHHRAEEALEAYVVADGVEDAKARLLQSVDPAGRLSGVRQSRATAPPRATGRGNDGTEFEPR